MRIDLDATEERPSDLTGPDARILDAAAELVGAIGIVTTMDQIARRAGVGRATVFRRFGSKEAIFARMITREVENGLSVIMCSVREVDDREHRAVRLCEMLFDACLNHPLIRYIARADPGVLASLGVTEQTSPLLLVRDALADTLAAAHQPAVDQRRLDLVADVFVHTMAGYTWMPHTLTEHDTASLRTLIAEQTVASARPNRVGERRAPAP